MPSPLFVLCYYSITSPYIWGKDIQRYPINRSPQVKDEKQVNNRWQIW